MPWAACMQSWAGWVEGWGRTTKTGLAPQPDDDFQQKGTRARSAPMVTRYEYATKPEADARAKELRRLNPDKDSTLVWVEQVTPKPPPKPKSPRPVFAPKK